MKCAEVPVRSMPGGDLWKGTEDTARYLGITPRTLYRLVDEGLVRAYRQGRVLRFRVADLDAYLDGQVVKPGELSHLYPPGSLDMNEGAAGDWLLAIDLDEHAIEDHEWIEEAKGYREWLVPAELANAAGSPSVVERP